MRRGTRSIWPTLVGFLVLVGGLPLGAPSSVSAAGTGAVSLSALGAAYMQDFDTLATTGTANTALPGGWYLAESGSSLRNNDAYAATSGGDTSGDVYSFGLVDSADRAFGSVLSGTLTPIIGAAFSNDSGSTIASLSVVYACEMWRAGVLNRNAADRLDFQLSTDATSLTTGSWTNHDAADCHSASINTALGAKNGNTAEFRGSISHTIGDLAIADGAMFWIRWTDFDISSSDDGLGIDDFSLTPAGGVAADPLINEFVANHAGTDTHEYVEVRGNPGADHSNYTVLQIEGDGAGAGVVDSAQTVGTTNADGYWTTGFLANAFENGTITLLLVEDFSGSLGQDLDTNNDGTLDVMPWERTVDDVAVSDGGAGDRTYASTVLAPGFGGSPFTPGGASRIPDGTDTESASDWMLNDFDGAGLPDFAGTLVFGEALNTPGSRNVASTGSSTLVINEVDYDQPSTDTAEFIELKNISGAAANLGSYAVRLVNGASGSAVVYQTIALPDLNLAAHGYFVICANAATVENCDLDVAPDTNLIQNGAPDAVAIVQGETIIDTLSYEGDTLAPYTEGSGSGLQDPGGSEDINVGLSRFPDGLDSNQNHADFGLSCITPGAANVATAEGCVPPPPDEQCGDAFTPIGAIQGTGNATPLAGQTVSTEGVVIGDYEGPAPTLRGFYIQDPAGDGDPASSDATFVFNGDNDSVTLGQSVRVSGVAQEFQDQTQIGNVNSITICTENQSVAPAHVTLPFAEPVAGVHALERFEGMLVRLPQTLYVTEHFQLGRFGQVVMSSGDRLFQPTNLVLPGAPAAEIQAANNRNRIIVDDDTQQQNPDPIVFGRGGNPLSASNTLRGGDTATGIIGVMTYTWAGNAASGNAYRVRPVSAMGGGSPDFQPANPRPAEAPDVGGTLRVSNFNVLNFFNTFSGCTGGVGGAPMDCRGAENSTEFQRQTAKIVSAIVGLDADVVGLMELENDGYGPTSAIAGLVAALNAATAPGTWAFIDADSRTGQLNSLGTDAIKNGIIYRPAAVTPVGQTAVLNSVAFVNGGDGSPRNRPTLTQAFMENSGGQTFIASVHHLKSKGSACDVPDQADGQGNCNFVRLNAVKELLAWLDTNPTDTADPDILILGDLNSYAREDPIRALEDAGYTNLVPAFLGEHAYSFVFDGQWGALDHALGSYSFVSQITGVAEWHINADEPNALDYNTNFKSAGQVSNLFASDEFRSSDHDPVVIGLSLRQPAGKLTGSGSFADGDFSINVQYRVNAALPSGNTALSVAGKTLISTAYRWLVVDGSRATFEGVGTVNGLPGYGFAVSVSDNGSPGVGNDQIRIKIWELGVGGAVIYDSQPGEHISAQPSSPLTAGNLSAKPN